MDTETVIALGFLIHQLLGFIGGIVLCYFGYRLLMRKLKGRQREGQRSWKSAKVFIKSAAPGILFTLFGAGAIWLTAANSFAPKPFAPKTDVPELAAKPLPSVTPDNEDDRLLMTLPAARPEMKLADRGMIPEDNSAVDHPPTPAPSPAPMFSPTPKSAPNPIPSATPSPAPKEPSVAGRKALEKERREAERKRSRLEDMYQKHLISSEAYKKGEEEYKNAIQRYRSGMNAGGPLGQ
jgi:hypothetical protein